MTTYTVLLPGSDESWENATAEQKATVVGLHEKFVRLMAERGHKITGGEELMPARTAKSIRQDSAGNIAVTDGPYAEAAEHVAGFYTVESDDLDDLLQVCGVLAGTTIPGTQDVVEVRQVVDHPGDGGA